MVYKKKGESSQVEGQQQAPGEGQRESRNNQRGKVERYKSKPRRNDGKDDEEEENFEEPKFTSAYQEYVAGYWRRPKKNKIHVTPETQIPAMPKIILEAPDSAAYHKAQADIDEKVDAINKKIKDLGEKFNERLAQLKSGHKAKKQEDAEREENAGNLGYIPLKASQELKGLFEQMRANTEERNRIYDVIEVYNKEITEAENKKVKAEKKVHPQYFKLDQLEKGIKELERKLTVTTTTSKQEKEIIKEMAFIKDSRPYIEEIAKLKDFIYQKKSEKYQVSQGISALK